MSSSYQQKHRHQADCSVPECAAPATTLQLLHGRPWWLCRECAAKLGALPARQC